MEYYKESNKIYASKRRMAKLRKLSLALHANLVIPNRAEYLTIFVIRIAFGLIYLYQSVLIIYRPIVLYC